MLEGFYTPLAGNTDRYQSFLIEDPVDYQDFLPSNRYYPGSTFCVKEQARFEFAVTDPSLVGVDKNWYYNRRYLGTYQISVPTGEEDPETKKLLYVPTGQDNPYYNGYITHTSLVFQRFHYITVADSTGQPRLYSKSHLDPCNYFSIGAEITLGGVTLSGERMQETLDIFTGRHYIVPGDLQSSQFTNELANISFYVAEGVILVSNAYRVECVNTIDNAASVEPEFSCLVFPELDCYVLYNDFLEANNYFGSQGFCEAAYPQGCYLQMVTYNPNCPPGEVWTPL
jgi:hypothetical protein